MAEDGHAHLWRDFDDALARFETDGRRFDEDWLIGEIVNVNDVLALCQIRFHKDTIDIAQFVANLRRILDKSELKMKVYRRYITYAARCVNNCLNVEDIDCIITCRICPLPLLIPIIHDFHLAAFDVDRISIGQVFLSVWI